jgi:hypothetical protein
MAVKRVVQMTHWRGTVCGIDERGAVGGVEGLAFGVLIFVFGTLMVLNAWAVVDGKIAAGAAAREATRSFVEATDERSALRAADEAARSVTSGRPNAATTVDLVTSADGFSRCGQVTAQVRIKIPRISLPFIGGTGGTFPVNATHTEVIDPYRSGLPIAGSCS